MGICTTQTKQHHSLTQRGTMSMNDKVFHKHSTFHSTPHLESASTNHFTLTNNEQHVNDNAKVNIPISKSQKQLPTLFTAHTHMHTHTANPKRHSSKTVNTSTAKFIAHPSSSSIDISLNATTIINYHHNSPCSQYHIIKKLGQGGYGCVWKVKSMKTGLIRAMKKIPKHLTKHNNTHSHNNMTAIINEIELLKQLDHPNIVKIFEYFIDNEGYYLITELCSKGELFDVIRANTRLSEAVTANIMYQLFRAVNYCHYTKNIIHRDLKPENILIESFDSTSGFYNIKVIDFGCAKIYEKHKKENKVIGSVYYISPEVLSKNYNEKCDVWSCGVILYLLLSGKVPFNGRNDLEILEKIQQGSFSFNYMVFDTISDDAKDLIKKCLEVNVAKRISAKDALKHKWFKHLHTRTYFTEVNEYFYIKTMNNLSKYNPVNKLQEIALMYLVHNFPEIDEVKNLHKVFNSINVSKTGKLTRKELTKAFQCFDQSEEIEMKVEDVFNKMDTDDNGFIENEEFIRAGLDKSIFLDNKVMKFVFDYFDKDGSGEICLKELMEVFGFGKGEDEMEYLMNIIQEIDTDGNGQISFNEFTIMMLKIIQV